MKVKRFKEIKLFKDSKSEVDFVSNCQKAVFELNGEPFVCKGCGDLLYFFYKKKGKEGERIFAKCNSCGTLHWLDTEELTFKKV